MDQKLLMNDNFNQVYKKASSRVRLLSSLKSNLDTKSASLVYKTMVTPLIIFNSIINLNITRTQTQKLNSLDDRARMITNNSEIPSTVDLIKRNACNIVYKSLHGQTCSNFKNYFNNISHEKNTRNNKFMLRNTED